MNEAILTSGGAAAYKAGVAIILLTALLTIWTAIVRDDGSGAGFFLIIMGAGVGAFATRAEAGGMARAMVGVAVMQAMLGLATATAPITAAAPDGVIKAAIFNGIGTLLWLLSAMFFYAAHKRSAK